MEGAMKPCIIKAFNVLRLIDVWVTPFIRITSDLPRLKHFQRFTEPFTSGNVPVVVQLMAVDAELAAQAARILTAQPGVSGINLNFACPSRQVVRHGAGGAQLKNPDGMFWITERIRREIPDTSLSVKLRCGFDDPAEITGWIGKFRECGADFAVIHCRTVKEIYEPLPKDERILRLKNAAQAANGLPVVANGDIYSLSDALEYMESFDYAGLMSARGIFRDPGLLQRLQGKEMQSLDALGVELFNKVLELSRSDEEIALRRSGLLETARMIWGSEAERFKNILKWTEEDFRCSKMI